MSDPLNKPLGVPLYPDGDYWPVGWPSIDKEQVIIYWGPNQDTESEYVLPDGWPNTFIPMKLPDVARFFFSQAEINTDRYRPSGSPPPPPPPPRTCSFSYEITPSYTHFIPADLLSITGEPIYSYWRLINGNRFFPNFAVGTSECNVSTIPAGPSETILYSGNVQDCPYLAHRPQRTITWLKTCTGGGVPDTTTVVGTIFATLPFGANPSQAPRCWFQATDGSWVSEVVSEAFTQYGCSAAHP